MKANTCISKRVHKFIKITKKMLLGYDHWPKEFQFVIECPYGLSYLVLKNGYVTILDGTKTLIFIKDGYKPRMLRVGDYIVIKYDIGSYDANLHDKDSFKRRFLLYKE